MKKVLIYFIVLFFLAGCNAVNENNEKLKIIVPTGIPLIALGGLINDDVIIDDVSGTNLLLSAITSKSHDIVIAPFNLGTKLYINQSSDYKLASILSIGNTYIVSKKESKLDSVKDLNGKTLLAFGEHSIPQIILNRALDKNNVICNIDYLANLNLIIPFFINNSNDSYEYILAAEPVITSLIENYNIDLNILDLQDLLKDEISMIIQAAVFINPNSKNKNKIDKFLVDLKNNIEVLNSNQNQYANNILNKHPYFLNLNANVIGKSIPRSNIVYYNSQEIKQFIIDYCEYLNQYNNEILSNKIPEEDFFYG